MYYQVMTRINVEKFYHDLKEKSITATNTLEESACEVNISKDQEVGYLSSGNCFS